MLLDGYHTIGMPYISDENKMIFQMPYIKYSHNVVHNSNSFFICIPISMNQTFLLKSENDKGMANSNKKD